jgi:hypothetical protein
MDRGFRSGVVDDERRLPRPSVIEKTCHFIGVMSEELRVQGAPGLELGGGERFRDREGRPERDRRDRFAHARSITKNRASVGF